MSIHKIGSDIIRPIGPKGTHPADRTTDAESGRRPAKPRADQVGFSPEALALAEEATRLEEGLSPERLAQIESRIAGGFYDTPDVAGQVASRLLDSGDL